jgi:phage replication O-like protein O
LKGPQLENGYTRIANEILEQLCKCNLNGTQRRILDVVFRQTYGYGRKAHSLSLTFISQATNLNKNQVQRELNKLISDEVLTVTKEATFNKPRELQFNKNIKEWSGGGQPTDKSTDLGLEYHTDLGLEASTDLGLEYQRKKERKNKESTNYKLVYDYYLSLNLIKHRSYTNDIKKAIAKALKDNNYTIDYAKTLLDRHKQVVEATKQSDYPVRVRGLTEFFGQKAYKATHLICSEYEEGGKLYEEHLTSKKVDSKESRGIMGYESDLGER